ncbi:histidine kinase [Nocardiopsis composta]
MHSAHRAPFAPLSAGTATVLAVLRGCLHAAFFLLLAVAAARLFTGGAGPADWAALAGAAVLGAVYACGPPLLRRLPGRRTALCWLALVTAVWAGLLLLSPDFSWLAFPLFFLHLHLLRRFHAVVAVAVITAAVIASQALHARELGTGMLLGPLLGAAFAVVIALGYATLYTESEQRRRLIEDLERARGELAESQHRAGALAERERLSREIHDTLAQGLSSIVLLLRSAEGRCGPTPAPRPRGSPTPGTPPRRTSPRPAGSSAPWRRPRSPQARSPTPWAGCARAPPPRAASTAGSAWRATRPRCRPASRWRCSAPGRSAWPTSRRTPGRAPPWSPWPTWTARSPSTSTTTGAASTRPGWSTAAPTAPATAPADWATASPSSAAACSWNPPRGGHRPRGDPAAGPRARRRRGGTPDEPV